MRYKFIIIYTLLFGLFYFNSNAYSVENKLNISDEKILKIKSNCSQIKNQINSVRISDALLRVNRGQLYEHLNSRLMIPLNTRVIANQLGGSELILTTSNYQYHLNDFRNRYITYEENISSLLNVDCKNDQIQFYEQLDKTRNLRIEVYKSIEKLSGDIQNYKKEVGILNEALNNLSQEKVE